MEKFLKKTIYDKKENAFQLKFEIYTHVYTKIASGDSWIFHMLRICELIVLK